MAPRAAVVLICLAAALLRDTAPSPLPEASAGDRPVATATPEVGAKAPATSKGTPSGLVAGRVVRPDGYGAPGATIVIAGSGLWPARQTHADDEGRFRIADVPPGVYEVRAHAGDLVAQPRLGLEIEQGSPVYLTFSLSEGAALHGIVRDSQTGDGVAGAEVTVSAHSLDAAPRAITTGAEGRFAVRGLTDGPRLVSVYAEGYVPVAALEHRPGRRLEIALEPAAILEGIVLDADGRPIEGATIEVIGEAEDRQPVALGPNAGFRSAVFASQLEPTMLPPNPGALEVTAGPVPPIPLAPTEMVALMPLPPSPAEIERTASFLSGPDGRFRITGIPPGRVQVIARRVGHAPASTDRIYVSAGAVRDGIELVLPPAGELHGTVVDGRGAAAREVMVEVRSDREPYPRVVFTDDRGAFRFEAVVGELTVTAVPRNRPAVRTSVTVASSETAEVALTLEGELHTLAGRVVDEGGYGVGSAQLLVTSLRADAPFRRTFFAAEDGTFSISELPAPPWRLQVSGPTFAPARVDLPSPEDDLEVVLAPGATVQGSVLDDYTGEPVAVSARLLRQGLPPEVRETQSGDDGVFRFARVPAGRWELRIESDAHLPVEQVIDVADDVELDTLRLEPAGWLEGTVVDALGVPLSRAEVWIEGGPRVRTGTDGTFVLRGATAGTVVVEASHPAAGSGQSAQQRVLAGRETLGVVVRLSERFDAERAEALPGRRRGVALQVSAEGDAIRVRAVVPGSHAERAGLMAGDVLESIDGVAPESARRAAALLRGASGVPAVLEIRRGDERATVLVEREAWLPP